MDVRTSVTHPLRVDELPLPGGDVPGRLGLTLAPGKQQRDAVSGAWARDLDADLDRLLEGQRTDLVVTLLEPEELTALGIEALPSALAARGIAWLHLQVPDGGVCQELRAWMDAVCRVRTALRAGQRVVVHCKGGLGRTGTLAAAVLTTFGMDPHEAMVAVRRARTGAIEHGAQERFVERSAGAWSTRVAQRVRGCLLGGAVGDALGAPVEFDTIEGIRSRCGPEGLRFMARAYGRCGAITDDTQMTLFTAEALVRAEAARRRGKEVDPAIYLERAYLRWLWTQEGEPREDQRWICAGWLFQQRTLHARRAPGNTCLSALRTRAAMGSVTDRRLGEPLNDSKGCGGVMRAAPAGLIGDAPYEVGCAAAALTHGHRAGVDTGGLLAEMVFELVEGATLPEAVGLVWARRRGELHEDTRAAVEAALALAAEDVPVTPERVATLGEGWVAEEALAIGIYCALAARTVEEGLLAAINHSGDSDSTGSIAGNLLGAAHGLEAMPSLFVEQVEAREIVDALAQALLQMRRGVALEAGRFPPT